MLLATAACQSVKSRAPQVSTQISHPNPKLVAGSPEPVAVTGAQRWEYAWNKAMDGVAVGAIAGGPYGVGGGFVIGLVAGLLMADSHYNAIQNQIYSEQQKNLHLEAAIERELARQAELEKDVFTAVGSPAETPSSLNNAGLKGSEALEPFGPTPEKGTIQRSSESMILATAKKPAADREFAKAVENVDVRDVNGDGVPDLWVYYNPKKPDEILRQEEASNYDGRVNIWNYFKNKQLVRREVDSGNHGRPDTVFYYVDDKITREERDESGAGRMTYRATYENGRLATVEKETRGDGRTDLWIFYDTTKLGEKVVREEKDLDGDGLIDVWSYYNDGRLVRRDVSAAGLKVFSNQEQLPAIARELNPF